MKDPDSEVYYEEDGYDYEFQEFDVSHSEETPVESEEAKEPVIKSANYVKPEGFHKAIEVALSLTCRRCGQEFYFNNKLHRHLRACKPERPQRKNSAVANVASPIPVLKSTNKKKNFNGFAFRAHHYAIVKKSLVLSEAKHELCLNSGTSMSLIDRRFLLKCRPTIIIHKTKPAIKMREIGSKIHDSSEYVELDLYIHEKAKNKAAIAHLKAEFHLIDDLKADILIGMDVMRPEDIILNFEERFMTIPTCQNFEAPISIRRKKTPVNRTVRATTQLIIPKEKTMAVSVRMRGPQIPADRDYSFYSKTDPMLRPEGGFFAHVTDHDIVAVQVRNTSRKPYVIPKNLKVGHLRDFDEEGCFLTASEDRHLAVTSGKSLDIRETLTKSIKETVLPNEITVYGDTDTVKKLTAIADETSQV